MAFEFPIFSGDPSEDPRETLRSFIEALRQFLDELTLEGRDSRGEPLFYDVLRPYMRPAWEEGRPLFAEVADAIRSNDGRSRLSNEAILSRGLWGAQLRFKFSVFRYLHGRYLTLGKGALRRLLEAIDTLLSSILSAIGGGEGIKELQEYIEHSLDA
jgi:hypothetical protein